MPGLEFVADAAVGSLFVWSGWHTVLKWTFYAQFILFIFSFIVFKSNTDKNYLIYINFEY